MNKRQRKKQDSVQYAFFGYEKFRKPSDFDAEKRLFHLEYKRYKREQKKQARVRIWRHRKGGDGDGIDKPECQHHQET